MKIKLQHSPYIANKIALDLFHSSLVECKTSLEVINKGILEILQEDIKREISLDERAKELLEENLDEIEFMRADERQLFWMIKKQIAQEIGFPLTWDERYSEISHKILNSLIEKKYIDFSISDTVIKNIIFKALDSYIKIYDDVQESVSEKLKNYKRKLVYGSEEYEIVFNKLYEEELKRRGFL